MVKRPGQNEFEYKYLSLDVKGDHMRIHPLRVGLLLIRQRVSEDLPGEC